MLSGGTQRRALPCYQSEEMKTLIMNDSYPRVGIEPTNVAIIITRLCPCATTASTRSTNVRSINTLRMIIKKTGQAQVALAHRPPILYKDWRSLAFPEIQA